MFLRLQKQVFKNVSNLIYVLLFLKKYVFLFNIFMSFLFLL